MRAAGTAYQARLLLAHAPCIGYLIAVIGVIMGIGGGEHAMSACARLAVACLVALALLCAPANAERLIATIAPSKIAISVPHRRFRRDCRRRSASAQLRAVVTVIGPRQDLIVRRKERVLGIWVNTSSSTFFRVPSYLAVSANRPFDDIASSEILRYHRIGLQHSGFADQSINWDDPFQANLINARLQEGLFVRATARREFRQPHGVPCGDSASKSAPTGGYKVEVHILTGGRPIAVEKIGLAQFVVRSAINYSLMYGLAIMGLARF